MLVRSLTLRNYRNYRELFLEFCGSIDIFLGANAQGKTNILEAVYYAALGRSHRTRDDGALIRWQESEAILHLALERMGAHQELRFEFRKDHRRQILWNGHPIRVKDLMGKLNVVLFSPEDLFLVKGSPAGRRRFLDGELSQASPAYYQELLSYTRLVSQRNALLKRIRSRKANAAMLEPWDAQLAKSAARITKRRMAAVKKLNMLANLMQRRISGNEENLSVAYAIHGMEETVAQDLFAWYNNKMNELREMDILRGSTGIGPHHDDLVLSVNGIDLRSYGSQGQQRTGALALKLSELEFLRSETGEYPVLLLDDVMSELDMSRRRQLLHFIGRERIQTLITATDDAYFPENSIGEVHDVRAGTATRRR